MGKIKIHQIAKSNNVASKEVIEIANKLKIEVKSHLSGVSEDEAKKIESQLGGNKKNQNDNAKEKTKKDKKEDKGPVIIRREEVVNRQEEIKEKQAAKKPSDVGFIKREDNKDFNLVYRNKQTTPMTVSELFGINKTVQNSEKKEDITPKDKEVIKEPIKEPIKEQIKEEKVEVSKISEEEPKTKVQEKAPEPVKETAQLSKEVVVKQEERTDNNRRNENNANKFNNDRNTNSNGNFNRERNNNGGYNRDRNNNGGYNRDNNGGYNRDRNNNGGYNRDNNNGGYNRDRNNNGGYNRDNNNGGYNRDRNNNGGYNRDNNNGGYNRDRNNNSGYNKDDNNGGYNRDRNNNGGYNRDNNNGGYNRDRNNNGGYNRDNNNGGYNRDRNNNNGGYNRDRNNNGGYNRDNNNGGYNRDNNGGGYNRNNNNGGYNRDNNNGGYNRDRNNNGQRRQFDNGNRRVEKDIQEIVAVDVIEKEVVRDYSKNIDKQKLNSKYDDSKNKKNKNRKNNTASIDEGKIKSLKQTNGLSNMFNNQEGEIFDYYDLSTQRGRKGKRKSRNSQEGSKQKIFKLTEITISETITVKDLAQEMKITTGDVIKKLIGLGIMATINNELDFDTAFLIAEEYGIKAIQKTVVTEEDILFDDSEDTADELRERPPVVVVMGHVDHGKTSLLDVIRKTNVIEGEAGGITQAIGAYKVKVGEREITFLDTPGHEAFTSMRSRGASITDIAILVVAANDGVMPQTIEAINHAKSAEIPIIVAINKMDLPDANIDKVKQELMAHELISEEWGGDTIFVPISAKKNENIDQLLEMVLLQADVLELKANPDKQSKGTVIEARLDKSKGPVTTMLVQRGKLDIGDTIVVGSSIGRIRTMMDDKGKKVKKAGPSTPVEITGLTIVPQAGDTFYEVKNEKVAKALIEKRKNKAREEVMNSSTKITLDNLFSKMEEGTLKQLNLIIKADVQGSVEAVKQSLEKLKNEEVKVRVVHSAAGAVNQSDVTLAKVSGSIIIAFCVKPDVTAKEIAEKDEIEIKEYTVIYKAIEDVEAALKGMLEPKYQEKVIGNVEIREVFKISNVGAIAGSYVLSGKVERNAGVRIVRDNIVVHEGTLSTLKRFKDDVKEVSKGFECGIQIAEYNDIAVGDNIEVYIMEELKR